jgi:hypothetical protein
MREWQGRTKDWTPRIIIALEKLCAPSVRLERRPSTSQLIKAVADVGRRSFDRRRHTDRGATYVAEPPRQYLVFKGAAASLVVGKAAEEVDAGPSAGAPLLFPCFYSMALRSLGVTKGIRRRSRHTNASEKRQGGPVLAT